LRLSIAIARLIVADRQLKTEPYERHKNAKTIAAHIDWPILAFWVTYFGIIFGILCGLISAAV
jgi:uncharacterized membrane protein